MHRYVPTMHGRASLPSAMATAFTALVATAFTLQTPPTGAQVVAKLMQYGDFAGPQLAEDPFLLKDVARHFQGRVRSERISLFSPRITIGLCATASIGTRGDVAATRFPSPPNGRVDRRSLRLQQRDPF